MEKRKVALRGLEFLCAAAIGVIASQQDWTYLWLGAPIALYVALMFYEYNSFVTDRQLRVREQLKLLMRLVSFDTTSDVRCTYHVPCWRKQIRQSFDYIPSGGGSGRRLSQNKGIGGKALSEKKWLVDNFRSDGEYRTEMVRKYGYTADELQKRRADRRSYFCYSLVDEKHKVIGLIYFDASRLNTFTLDETDPKMKMLIDSCDLIKDGLV